MKIYVAEEFGAQNSKPVFRAFIDGLHANNVFVVSDYTSADVICIWSFLFSGRMAGNRLLYDYAKDKGIPLIVLEVGAIERGKTWKVGINGINNTATWCKPYDKDRPERLNIEMLPWVDTTAPQRNLITILTQRPDSQQWIGKPHIEDYVRDCIQQVRDSNLEYDGICVRPHPRDHHTDFAFLNSLGDDIYYDCPNPLADTYDSFDHDKMFKRSKLIFNYSSGPSVQAALAGIPVICSEESLAWEVSVQDINNITYPDRTDWLLDLAHTEWTVEEMKSGSVWKNLANSL